MSGLRWAARLRQLGFRVFLEEQWSGRPCALLVALHARKSHDSLVRFRAFGAPTVVAATGTDVYGDAPPDETVLDSLRNASRIVVLQELGLAALPPDVRDKARVVWQSVTPPSVRRAPANDVFEVCVLAHLRPVKDPLLAARAARLLPEESRLRVLLLGGLRDPALGPGLERERAENPRFEWLGARRRGEALWFLSGARALVATSRHEGGPNAISEALALHLPILCTAIPGALGLVGADHPATFPAGDAPALARLLERLEEDGVFRATLAERSRARAWITEPERERQAWQALVEELGVHP